jgi:hypothetical protein
MFKYFIDFKDGNRIPIGLWIGTREDFISTILYPLDELIDRYGIIPANQQFIDSDLEIIITNPKSQQI